MDSSAVKRSGEVVGGQEYHIIAKFLLNPARGGAINRRYTENFGNFHLPSEKTQIHQ